MLTPKQQSHYESVRWLIRDGNRRSGRTFLMAYIFVEEALQNPGRTIHIFNHMVGMRARDYMVRQVSVAYDMMTTDKQKGLYPLTIRPNAGTIRID